MRGDCDDGVDYVNNCDVDCNHDDANDQLMDLWSDTHADWDEGDDDSDIMLMIMMMIIVGRSGDYGNKCDKDDDNDD